jgi:hypothetical protein
MYSSSGKDVFIWEAMSTPHVDKTECEMASTAINRGDPRFCNPNSAISLVLGPSKNVENWPTYLANRLQSKAIGSIFDRIRVATSGEIFLWTSNAFHERPYSPESNTWHEGGDVHMPCLPPASPTSLLCGGLAEHR